MPKGSKRQLGRQVHLPVSRAFFISMKSIKMRLGRSIITAAGVFLGIAFLVSVLAQGLVQWPVPPTKIRPGFAKLDGEFEAPGDHSVWKPVAREEALAAGIPQRIVERMAGASTTFSLTDLVTQLNLLMDTETSIPDAKATAAAYDKLALSVASKKDADMVSSDELKAAGLPDKEVQTVAAAGSVAVSALKTAKDKAAAALTTLESTQKGLSELHTVPASAIEKLSREKAITVAELFVKAKPTPGADLTKVMIVNHGRKVGLDLSKNSAAGSTPMVAGDAVLIPDAASGNRSIWLAMMALLVCTIGITNSMLMSVTERFREIGTMKCLGALDSFVVELFLFESGFLGIIASATGALVGLLATITMAVANKGFIVLAQVGLLDVLKMFVSGVLVGCLVTVIAMIVPAVRAAQMPPAAALRTEV